METKAMWKIWKWLLKKNKQTNKHLQREWWGASTCARIFFPLSQVNEQLHCLCPEHSSVQFVLSSYICEELLSSSKKLWSFHWLCVQDSYASSKKIINVGPGIVRRRRLWILKGFYLEGIMFMRMEFFLVRAYSCMYRTWECSEEVL